MTTRGARFSVTVISGPPGSEGTAVPDRVLTGAKGIAVVVNGSGEIRIDGAPVLLDAGAA